MVYYGNTGKRYARNEGMIISKENNWKVGEFAKLTGLTIRTLRYYDQIGLYSPSDYSKGGYRLFNESDLLRLQQILALKELGLSLEEVKSVLDKEDYNPEEVISLQISRLKENISKQQKLLKELQNISSLLQKNKTVTVEDFTKLLGMMKKSHQSYFIGRQKNVERHLDRLGNFLVRYPNDAEKGGTNNE
ncbi:transcriptional regulator, merr family [Neobacillus massiliamazoniensis]|uniref:Transcriptional regulator, merr family n=2 Tax=Neobacillus massiliamazoniensis TaxID=1499688 RepID=A0A0U1NZQ5_9BACI|nr:transcriptional regulator, merr family [Neobacillus massiliamazoniensis]